jgi:hypothetical protein
VSVASTPPGDNPQDHHKDPHNRSFPVHDDVPP